MRDSHLSLHPEFTPIHDDLKRALGRIDRYERCEEIVSDLASLAIFLDLVVRRYFGGRIKGVERFLAILIGNVPVPPNPPTAKDLSLQHGSSRCDSKGSISETPAEK